MALSGSTNFSMTAAELVNAAYRKLGVKIPGQSITAQEQTDAIEALNVLIKSWGPRGLKVWLHEETGVTLVASDKDYSITATTTDLPLDVERAWLRDIAVKNDIPLTKISREEYQTLPNKTTEGTPTQFYYHRSAPESTSSTGIVYLWPAPDSTAASKYTLYISWRKPVDDIDASTNDIEFPNTWYRAIIWNLASELLAEYDVPEDTERNIVRNAKQSLMDAEDYDTENSGSVYLQPNTEWTWQ